MGKNFGVHLLGIFLFLLFILLWPILFENKGIIL